jgi:hypothetical protein
MSNKVVHSHYRWWNFVPKVDDQTFVTSKRKTDFNRLPEVGMVLVKTDGPDTVLAYGAKPSVGGQSQRIIFKDHPGYDCVLHFHCKYTDSMTCSKSMSSNSTR